MTKQLKQQRKGTERNILDLAAYSRHLHGDELQTSMIPVNNE